MINPLNLHYSFTTPATVHDEEAMTSLELAGRQGAKINEIIKDQNNLRQETENRLDEQEQTKIPSTVKNEIQKEIENGSFTKQINRYMGDLKKQTTEIENRLDNLSSNMTEGSTTLDVEVIDIRVGADGVSYPNAGSSVRTNMKKKVDNTFLFDKFNNLAPEKTLTLDYKGGTAQNVNSEVFTLPQGNYYMCIGDTSFLEVMLVNSSFVRLVDALESGVIIPFTIQEDDANKPLYIYAYASINSENTVGMYSVDIKIFKQNELPKINGKFLGKMSLMGLEEINAEIVLELNHVSSVYSGGLWNANSITTLTLQSGDYHLIIGESNYNGLLVYDEETLTQHLYVEKTNISGGLSFKIPESFSGKRVVISAHHSFGEEKPTGNYYMNNIVLYHGAIGLPDWVMNDTQLAKDVEQLKISVGANLYHDMSTVKSESLVSGGRITLTNFPYYIKKNVAFVMTGKFTTFKTIKIGHGGSGTYGSMWFQITTSSVNMYKYYENEVLESTTTHGLSLRDFITVIVSYDEEGNCYLSIISKEGQFQKVYDNEFVGSGALFLESGQLMTDVSMSATCEDFSKPLWMIGDSYFGASDDRVYGQLRNFGFNNYMVMGIPGLGSNEGYTDLVRALNFGTPKYLIWYLGMNDGASSEPYKTNFEKVYALCVEKGITLIANKVPSVPTIAKEEISNVIENSGVRYIDSYKSVVASSSGWYSGMLSSDGVHPTILGAKILASQTLVDVPEIMKYGRKEN